MIVDKAYAYDLSVPEYAPKRMPSKDDFKIIKNPDVNKVKKVKTKPKSKLSLLVSSLAIFAMCIIISIRYNTISEKNLELQRLKMEQTKVSSELATTEVQADKVIDKDKVEAYAKQQLGMQKPEKNQIIYVNSEMEVSVDEVSNQNVFLKGLSKLKNLIGIK